MPKNPDEHAAEAERYLSNIPGIMAEAADQPNSATASSITWHQQQSRSEQK